MKPNQQLATCGIVLKLTLQIVRSFSAPLRLLLAALVFCATSASAQQLIWDAGNTNNGAGIDPGSGAWDTDTTTNFNWNTGSGNTNWTQVNTTTPQHSAAFNGPGAADGTYQVVVDDVAGQISASNLTINASGYMFSGSPIDLRNTTSAWSATNLFVVADGISVTINNNLSGANNSSEFRLGGSGNPATVVLNGTLTGFQPRITSTNGSIFIFGGSGANSDGGNCYIDADVRMTNGTWNSAGSFIIARRQNGSQPLNGTGSFTIDGPNTIFNQNGDYLSVGRDSVYNATLIVQNGATLNDQTFTANNNPGIAVPRVDSSGVGSQSRMYVYGGTVNMGGSSIAAQPIWIGAGGSRAGQVSALTQTGGVINAWGGIQIGGSTGTYDGGSAMVTNSGGFLYLGSLGGSAIRYGVTFAPTNIVFLTGGTVGTLQSWISSVPMTLGTLNGNITFQCADVNTTPFNISLSGALTGAGGFNKTGGGVMTLTGPNNYAGLTAVSDGTLAVSTINSPANGDVVIDGSTAASGLPIMSNIVASAGQSWTMGNLTFSAGTPTLSFNFGVLTPSLTVAPMQVNGNLAFTVAPQVTIAGSDVSASDYPLIHYTGAFSGALPSSLSLPSGVSATIVNDSVGKNIVLHVTAGPSPNLSWGVGNGIWDINTTANWKQFNASTVYVDGNPVQFDDSATGTSPITVTLNTPVNPSAILAVNATKAYTISGTGAIGGSVPVSVIGAGSLTLSNANTYTGGTTVSAPGQLNINFGGDGGASSAIGTGALNLNTGAKLANTSGHAVVLNAVPPIPVNMIDDWSFVGSNNLDLGLGQATLGNVQVILTVVTNTLTVANQITDNGLAYQLVKAGNGALTLSNANTFSGGFNFNAGTLNINADGAVGTGPFNISGGTLDNTSGSTVTLGSVVTPPSAINLGGTVIFKGTTNLDLGATLINVAATTMTLTTNTLFTEGVLDAHNSPGLTINGSGTWDIGGFASDNTLSVTINGGKVLFDKSSGNAVNGNTTAVNTNGTLVMAQPTGIQMATTATLVLGGGTVDLNGDSENPLVVTFNSGTLQNNAPSSFSTLFPPNGVVLASAGCVFGVATADSTLTVSNVIGSGGLVKAGLGLLNLVTNSYAGNTTISNGTLVLNFPTIATTSTVTVNTNATLGTNGVLTLNFANAETNAVAALVLGGVNKPAGLYSATTDPLYITGTGSLLVVSPINPLPGVILLSNLGGGNLGLGWPTNSGWILLSNSIGLTATNSWFAIPNSTNLTNLNIVVDSTKTNVFFRLLHP